jgi:D-sedoheptulose 7-phosphate isomerase
MVFAQQVFGYGKKEDVFIGLSTSGNSKNVVNAAKVATSIGMKCICMTGAKDSQLSKICSVALRSPSNETYRVQEFHIMIYHAICAMIESEFFKE